MPHCLSPAAEKVLDKPIKVLDKGFVRLVDYMGDDSRIVAAARVSYGAGTKTFREDRGLINYLLRNEHTSPFEQVVFTFHAKMPIFVARQWIRHRTARVNEISGRYSVMKDEFYLPALRDVAFQSTDNKQGRSSEAVPKALQRKVLRILTAGYKRTYADYRTLLGKNIARELARINLPVSLYTEWYWQIDLNNLFHFLRLRLDAHAQWEIRQYAAAIAGIAQAVAPLAYAAFERHMLQGRHFSGDEVAALRSLLKGEPHTLTGRRRAEFEAKLSG